MKKVFFLLPLAAFALADVETRDSGGDNPPTGMLQLYRQVNTLQEEVQALRGMLEEQAFAIQQLLGSDRAPILPAPKLAPTESANDSETDEYKDAMHTLETRNYDQAFAKFNELTERYPTGRFAANSLYWAGEISMLQGKTAEAKKRFSLVLEEHTKHPKAADALLKLGFIAEKEGKVSDARAILIDVKTKYPHSASARLAEARLAKLG